MITYRKEDAPAACGAIRTRLACVFDNIAGDYWIAGGAVLEAALFDTRTSDADLFFRSEGDLERALGAILQQDGHFDVKGEKVYKATLEALGRIDLIRNIYSDPLACIETFDFTVACCAVDRNGLFYCHDQFFQHVAARKLEINAVTFPLSTIKRIEKYARKGFSLSPHACYQIASAAKDAEDLKPAEFYGSGG